MKYSTGLADRALVGACSFQAEEKGRQGRGSQSVDSMAPWIGLMGQGRGRR